MVVIINEVGSEPKVVEVVGAEVVEKNEEKTESVENLVEKKDSDLKPVEDFKAKDDLEAYGLTFGVDLNKSKTIANMYADLVEALAK
ncbi:MAG: hypothetical protein ACPG9K_00920 [Poseidonibacter sp.]